MTRQTVLVVGATGQLGGEVVNRLSRLGSYRVRALVRGGARHAHLQLPNVEVVTGDLRNRESLERACKGVDLVIATATVVFPRGPYSFKNDEESGYNNLITACERLGVDRVVYVSLAIPFKRDYLRASPTYRTKHFVEQRLERSSLEFAIIRCAPFMDDYFALIGSCLPLAGEAAATLDRATGITRALRWLLGRSIDKWGVAIVPGRPGQQHAFVAVADVAETLVVALSDEAPRRVIELGGPQALSWRNVCNIYGDLLGRHVSIISLPLSLVRVTAWLSRPLSESFSNQLAILWILGEHGTGDLVETEGCLLGTLSAQKYLSSKVNAHR